MAENKAAFHKVEQNDEQVDAQVAGELQPAPEQVRDFSTVIEVDEVVRDPRAENAVLVEGQGGEGLPPEELVPLHGYANLEHHEDVFAREASESSDEDESK